MLGRHNVRLGNVSTKNMALRKLLNILWPQDDDEARKSDPIAQRAEIGMGAVRPVHAFSECAGPNGTARAIPVAAIVELLNPKLQELQHELGFDDQRFSRVVMPMIHRYVGWTHLLPASANHHHSRLGGLASHGIEVATLAARATHNAVMDFDTKFMRDLELRSKRRSLWPLAAATAAMHHDIGKPLIDLLVTSAETGSLWNPFVEPIDTWVARERVAYYAIRWRPGPRLNRHEAFGVLLMGQIAGHEVFGELSGFGRDVMEAVVIAVIGNENDAYGLAQMVAAADAESSKTDRSRLSEFWSEGSMMSDPIVNRLLESANALLKRRSWAVNGPGHPILLSEQGAYLIWPKAFNSMMKELQQQQRAVGIPNDPVEVAQMFVRAGVAKPRILTSGQPDPLWALLLPEQGDSAPSARGDFDAFVDAMKQTTQALFIPDPSPMLNGVAVAMPMTVRLAPEPGATVLAESDAPTPADGSATATDVTACERDVTQRAGSTEPVGTELEREPDLGSETPIHAASKPAGGRTDALEDAPLDEPGGAGSKADDKDPGMDTDSGAEDVLKGAGKLGTALADLARRIASDPSFQPNEYVCERRNGPLLVRWPNAIKCVSNDVRDIADEIGNHPEYLSGALDGRELPPGGLTFSYSVRGKTWNVIALSSELSSAFSTIARSGRVVSQ